jgi:hypothetical protein
MANSYLTSEQRQAILQRLNQEVEQWQKQGAIAWIDQQNLKVNYRFGGSQMQPTAPQFAQPRQRTAKDLSEEEWELVKAWKSAGWQVYITPEGTLYREFGARIKPGAL